MSGHFRTTRRRNRMLRKQSKRKVVTLNLVSMIDMFTVLVFFLLITTSSVATIRNPRALDLPNSVSIKQPSDTPVLTITRDLIQLQGQTVMTVTDAEHDSSATLSALKTQLLQAPLLSIKGDNSGRNTRGDINIMADKSTPYSLLKKVMATCGDAAFARISLSVNHVSRHRT